MRVLSLFDGIGCGAVSLVKAGIQFDEYISYEIDKKAQSVVERHVPQAVLKSDVMRFMPNGNIDLLIGGSPCQGFSNLGKKKGFEDDRSKLYFQFERILEVTKPKYWLLENVVMSKANQQVITNRLGVKPLVICASEISGIRRKRLYWTNIPQLSLEHTEITPSNVIDWDNKTPSSPKFHRWYYRNLKTPYIKILRPDSIAYCQTARQIRNYNGNAIDCGMGLIRFLTPEECEAFHDVPVGYTDNLSDNHRYKALGNGWAVQVTKQLLRGVTS